MNIKTLLIGILFLSGFSCSNKAECLLVWKKEDDTWRIFRDVFKPEK